MKNLGMFSLLFLLMAACDPISGQLKLSRGIDVNNSGLFGSYKTRVEAGSYNASVEFSSRTDLLVKVRTAQGSTKIWLKIPEGKDVASYSGPISLKARESGQSFDLVGQIDTQESDSSTTRTTESCTYTREKQVYKDGKWVTETVSYPGTQEVEYHYHETDTSLSLQLRKPGTKERIGTFSGARNKSSKVYDYEGTCY